jgi:hypothetical protein
MPFPTPLMTPEDCQYSDSCNLLDCSCLPPDTRTYFMIAICLHLSVAYLGVGRGERRKRRACQKFESVYAVARIRDVSCDWPCCFERRAATTREDFISEWN